MKSLKTICGFVLAAFAGIAVLAVSLLAPSVIAAHPLGFGLVALLFVASPFVALVVEQALRSLDFTSAELSPGAHLSFRRPLTGTPELTSLA